MSSRIFVLAVLLVFLAGCGSQVSHREASPSGSPGSEQSTPAPPAPQVVPSQPAAKALPAEPRGKPAPSKKPSPSKKGGLQPVILPIPPIVKRFIPFGPERLEQMRRYSLLHYGIDSWRLVNPRLVIEHFTETPDFQSTYNIFAPDVPDSQYHELPNTCSHFVVDRNGVIYQLVPLNVMCRSVVGLNYTAVAIENVGYSDQEILENPKEMKSSLDLTRWLRCRYDIPVGNVIGHNESLSSPYYRELVPAFRGQTHSDWNRQDMEVYRHKLEALPCR